MCRERTGGVAGATPGGLPAPSSGMLSCIGSTILSFQAKLG
jgi:hypothetical protein